MYLKSKLPQAETKADPFSLAALVAWLRTKPGDEEYRYVISEQCALSQFAETSGHASVFDLDPREMKERHPLIHNAVNHSDQTFGALAERLEAALSADRLEQALGE